MQSADAGVIGGGAWAWLRPSSHTPGRPSQVMLTTTRTKPNQPPPLLLPKKRIQEERQPWMHCTRICTRGGESLGAMGVPTNWESRSSVLNWV